MLVKPFVGLADERAVESSLTVARLVTCNQKYGSADRIERESNPPLPIGCAEPHLLHICVA